MGSRQVPGINPCWVEEAGNGFRTDRPHIGWPVFAVPASCNTISALREAGFLSHHGPFVQQVVRIETSGFVAVFDTFLFFPCVSGDVHV